MWDFSLLGDIFWDLLNVWIKFDLNYALFVSIYSKASTERLHIIVYHLAFAKPVGIVLPDEQTHPPVARLVAGGISQTTWLVYGNTVVVGAVPLIVSALTKIGITAPVDKPKGMWPRTAKRLEASPEWVVKLNHVSPSKLKIWSRSVFERRFCAVVVSEVEYRNKRSNSLNPGSIV